MVVEFLPTTFIITDINLRSEFSKFTYISEYEKFYF